LKETLNRRACLSAGAWVAVNAASWALRGLAAGSPLLAHAAKQERNSGSAPASGTGPHLAANQGTSAGPAADRGTSVRLAAAWDDAAGAHHVGVLQVRAATVQVLASMEVPTRAHGVLAEAAGRVLFAARRPGDWLLRWTPGGGRPQWLWSDADRRFTGHVADHPAWPGLCSVETDLESGQGLVVTRDRRTLQRLAEWPTGGIDPHQLLPQADGSLLLANGGVPTLPETGRVKRHLERMDPSLVRLDPRTGQLLGQWRLDDPRLSIRHLARHRDGTIGISLQAEHDDPAARAQAPLLALFDGQALRTAAAPQPLAGYGGDIAATDDGFAIGASRAGGVAHWSADGNWLGFTPLPEACAMALAPSSGATHTLWAGGRESIAQWTGTTLSQRQVPALRLDNHWVVLAHA
jgi:hypothetical protein